MTSPDSCVSATAVSARSWDGEQLCSLFTSCFRQHAVPSACRRLVNLSEKLFTDFFFFFYPHDFSPSPVIMRPAASSLASSVALSPRWPPQRWWTKSQSTRGRTPPCSPGRSETGCWPRVCATATRCPASAPLTGDKLNYGKTCVSVRVCVRV